MKLNITIEVKDKGEAKRIVTKLFFEKNLLIQAQIDELKPETFDKKSPKDFLVDPLAKEQAVEKRRERYLEKIPEMSVSTLKKELEKKGVQVVQGEKGIRDIIRFKSDRMLN